MYSKCQRTYFSSGDKSRTRREWIRQLAKCPPHRACSRLQRSKLRSKNMSEILFPVLMWTTFEVAHYALAQDWPRLTYDRNMSEILFLVLMWIAFEVTPYVRFAAGAVKCWHIGGEMHSPCSGSLLKWREDGAFAVGARCRACYRQLNA